MTSLPTHTVEPPAPKQKRRVGRIAVILLSTLVVLYIAMEIYGRVRSVQAVHRTEEWLTEAFPSTIVVAGIVVFAMGGIAFTGLISNADSGPAIVQVPFLTLQFISGVYFPYASEARFLKTVADVFPFAGSLTRSASATSASIISTSAGRSARARQPTASRRRCTGSALSPPPDRPLFARGVARRLRPSPDAGSGGSGKRPELP